MAVREVEGPVIYIDGSGDKNIIYPVTKAELVDGLDDAINGPVKSHNHDDRYYTKAETDTRLSGKADTSHTHDLSGMINTLGVGTDDANDDMCFVAQNSDISNHTYYRRKVITIWNYIKAKADGVYAARSHSHTKADVGLGNVDNTADSEKQVRSAERIRNDSLEAALTGNSIPASGLTVGRVYANGYPVSYGNVITVHGSGSGQILAAWSGVSGAVERLYYRNKRDVSDAPWSEWKPLAFTDDKPANAGAADRATNAEYVGNDETYMRFHWHGQSGQPNWVWGGNAGGDMYVWNPSNFSVNHAVGAGNVNGYTFAAQTTDPGAGSALDNGKVLLVYV